MTWHLATPEDGENAYVCGCHLWDGQTDRDGTPVIHTTQGNTTAAKALGERKNGPVPKGKVLGSLCGETLCVRPRHREPMTHRELAYRYGRTALTPRLRDRAYRLVSSGMSRRKVAELMNVDESTIRHALRELDRGGKHG